MQRDVRTIRSFSLQRPKEKQNTRQHKRPRHAKHPGRRIDLPTVIHGHALPPVGLPAAPASARQPPALSALVRSEEHTSELQSQSNLVCRLLLEKKKIK